MSEDIPARMRTLVRARAGGRCEYCLQHEDHAWEPHQPDHIVAIKHRGPTAPENLAWTCALCNRAKGSDIASLDDVTGRIVRLFHPRQDIWSRHFRLAAGRILPRTRIGRVTEFLLQFNDGQRVQVRRSLIRRGLYP